MSKRNRRELLEHSIFAAAAAVAASSAGTAWAADEKPASKSPNEKLGVAGVGTGGRGKNHLGAVAGRSDTEVLYLVDVDPKRAAAQAIAVAKKQAREPKIVEDM